MNAEQLIGVWRLEEFLLRDGDETSRPFGERPKGRLHVAANGELLVSILAQDRARLTSHDLQGASPAEAVAVLRGALSYFGRWRFDPARALLETEVEGALFPNLEPSVQARLVEFLGPDALVLTTPPVLWQGQERRGVLRWTRMPA
jgi:hypothetical protein